MNNRGQRSEVRGQIRWWLAFLFVMALALGECQAQSRRLMMQRTAAAAGGGGGYALTFHTEKGGGGTGGITTDPVTSSGTLIVVAIHYYNDPGVTPISDNKGNTWTALNTYGSGVYFVKLYYCVNPTIGASHTWTTTGNYSVISVLGFSGNAGSPFDAQNGNNSSGATIQPGAITPAENKLAITALTYVSGTSAVDSGFTKVHQTQSGTDGLFGAIAYTLTSGTGSVNPTWSGLGASTTAANIASFK